MRTLSSLLFGVVLFAPGVQAQPLPPGKPAGVQQAGLGTTGMILLVTAGLIVVVGALGVAMGNAQSSSGT